MHVKPNVILSPLISIIIDTVIAVKMHAEFYIFYDIEHTMPKYAAMVEKEHEVDPMTKSNEWKYFN